MKVTEARLDWALDLCRRAQVRMTPVRQGILAFLAAQHLPVSLDTIARADGVGGHCDATTVYRTLMMFTEADLVRLVGSSRKKSHFWLNVPGGNNHFLICRACGRTVPLNLPRPIENQISGAAAASGFSPAKQDCEVHGVCLACQQVRQREPLPSKLTVGPCAAGGGSALTGSQ